MFDAFWEKNLKPWDTAAGALMVPVFAYPLLVPAALLLIVLAL